MEQLGFNLGLLITFLFSFLILFVVLRAWVYNPILGMLEKRRKIQAQGLEDARVASEAKANAEREAARIISEAQGRAQTVIHEAEERAESLGREIREQAQAEANKAREQALQGLEQERERNLSDLRGQVTNLVIAASRKLIGETLDESRQRTLLDEFFSGVRQGKVPALSNMRAEGQAAEVTSALPLTSSEQDTIKRDILGSLGSSASVVFRVDPSILGGLIIRVGDQVVDASVSGQLQELRGSLS